MLSTCGDSFLGGEDFDQRVIEWMVSDFQAETGIYLGEDALARQRLKETVEKTKNGLEPKATPLIQGP